jgi:outer membrane protein assembly factor BamD
MKGLLLVCLSLLLIVSGCAWWEPKEEKSAQELVQDGVDYFEAGKYKKAVESFEKLRDWYPFSRYAILAELKIADAYFNLESYADAIFAYEEFEQLHPRNEAIPYVVFRIGRSYFNQIDTIDRDQSNAAKALEVYLRLIRQYPDDAYAGMAKSDVVACYQSLSGHEFYVGTFYYKNKNYKAAKARFRAVVEKYPDVGHHYQALTYLANCDAWIKSRFAATAGCSGAMILVSACLCGQRCRYDGQNQKKTGAHKASGQPKHSSRLSGTTGRLIDPATGMPPGWRRWRGCAGGARPRGGPIRQRSHRRLHPWCPFDLGGGLVISG